MSETSSNRHRRTAGYAMMWIGFLMVLANALDYLFGWEANLIPLLIIGLGLVAVGMNLSARR